MATTRKKKPTSSIKRKPKIQKIKLNKRGTLTLPTEVAEYIERYAETLNIGIPELVHNIFFDHILRRERIVRLSVELEKAVGIIKKQLSDIKLVKVARKIDPSEKLYEQEFLYHSFIMDLTSFIHYSITHPIRYESLLKNIFRIHGGYVIYELGDKWIGERDRYLAMVEEVKRYEQQFALKRTDKK